MTAGAGARIALSCSSSRSSRSRRSRSSRRRRGADVLLVTLVSIALLRGAVAGAVVGFVGRPDRRRRHARDARADLAAAHPRRVLGRALRRDDRPRPSARPARGDGGRDASRRDRRVRARTRCSAGPSPAARRSSRCRRARLNAPARLPGVRARAPVRGRDRAPWSARGRWSSLSEPPYGERRNTSPRFLPPDPNVSAPYRLTPGLAVAGRRSSGSSRWRSSPSSSSGSGRSRSSRATRYLDAAQNNQLRTIRVEAPRGPILDRQGRVIVGNVPGTAVKLWVGDMPKKEGRYRMIKRLAAVLDVPVGAPRARGGRPADRPADADHRQDGRARRPGLLPARARVGVPGRADPADVPARLPLPVARGADRSATWARSRRRS